MKTTISILAFLISFNVFAGCEDGTSIAEEGVIRYVSGKFPQAKRRCEATSVRQKETKVGEIHLVELYCDGREVATFAVALEEYEDAICGLSKIKKVQ